MAKSAVSKVSAKIRKMKTKLAIKAAKAMGAADSKGAKMKTKARVKALKRRK